MKKRTILFVPPRGFPIKAIKIRLSVAIFLLLFIMIGFLGYFIPFNNFSLNVVEFNQKKNLSEQNKALLQKTLSTLRLLNNLKEQVSQLEEKKTYVARYGRPDSLVRIPDRRRIDFSKMESNELLRYVQNQANLLQSFLSQAEQTSTFDLVPVINPVQGKFIISRVFGVAVDPFTSEEKMHYGLDYVAEEGTPVIATASGRVTRIENNPVWGIVVEINYGYNYRAVYAHLGRYLVSKGRTVKRGQIIGTIGISGLSTGPHLHYEILRDGVRINPQEILFPSELNSHS